MSVGNTTTPIAVFLLVVLVAQSLLLDTPLAAEDGFLLPMTVATVAVFTCPLDLPSQFHSLETADGLPSHRRIERHHAHGALARCAPHPTFAKQKEIPSVVLVSRVSSCQSLQTSRLYM
jgi:hypothetical protein